MNKKQPVTDQASDDIVARLVPFLGPPTKTQDTYMVSSNNLSVTEIYKRAQATD